MDRAFKRGEAPLKRPIPNFDLTSLPYRNTMASMTAKRVPSKSEQIPSPPPKLAIPREDAESQLASRIEIGRGLLASTIRSPEEYETVKHKYNIWHDYNTELLRRIFDSEEISRSYSFSVSFGYPETLTGKIEYLFEDIRRYADSLESIKERLPLYPEPSRILTNAATISTGQTALATKKVFVVHGADHGVKETVTRFLSKVKLEPIILHEQPNLGNTIIEKLERNSLVAFSIILLTPDDKGCPISEDVPLIPRARQNVIFELGYFIGKLGRNKVCALYVEGVGLPSDFHGVVYIPFDKDGAWQLRLAKELKAAGLDIDLNTLC